MEFINRSHLPAEVFTSLDKSGQESLVIVAKATYQLFPGRQPALADVHQPIAMTDRFSGEPGTSAPIYEADLVPFKRKCDVLLDATAHVPGGRPVTELPVGLQIAQISQKFLVIGERVWKTGAFTVESTRPRCFTAMPLHYGRAFGGSPRTRSRKDDRIEQAPYLQNPVGVGYAANVADDAVEGMALPNTEDFHDRVKTPTGGYRPLAFGPIGRHWTPRRGHAGTYDAEWRDEVFPLLPNDFDTAFFQSAPAERQMDFPRGGEGVVLHHLVRGHSNVTFELPGPDLLLKVLSSAHTVEELVPVVDTVFIEPDEGRLTYVYRASIRLGKRGVFGVKLVAAGPVCKKWWASKVLGTEDCGCSGEGEADDPGARPAEPGALFEVADDEGGASR